MDNHRDTIFAITTICIAFVVGLIVFRYPMESSYFPRVIVGFLFFMGVFLLIRLNVVRFSIKRSKHATSQDNVADIEETEKPVPLKSAGFVFIAIVGYIIAIKVVNYEIATVAFFFLTILLLGFKNILWNILISVGLSFLIYTIFFYLLTISRPDSLFFS